MYMYVYCVIEICTKTILSLFMCSLEVLMRLAETLIIKVKVTTVIRRCITGLNWEPLKV